MSRVYSLYNLTPPPLFDFAVSLHTHLIKYTGEAQRIYIEYVGDMQGVQGYIQEKRREYIGNTQGV